MFNNPKASYEEYKQSIKRELDRLLKNKVITESSYAYQVNNISSFEEY